MEENERECAETEDKTRQRRSGPRPSSVPSKSLSRRALEDDGTDQQQITGDDDRQVARPHVIEKPTEQPDERRGSGQTCVVPVPLEMQRQREEAGVARKKE